MYHFVSYSNLNTLNVYISKNHVLVRHQRNFLHFEERFTVPFNSRSTKWVSHAKIYKSLAIINSFTTKP